MEFPLSKREMQILKEIEDKFNSNPHKLYIVTTPEEFAVHREMIELLKEKGFVKENPLLDQGEYYAIRRKQSYTLLTDFSEINNWIEDQSAKAKKLSRREWKIAIVSAIIGALIGLIPSFLNFIK